MVAIFIYLFYKSFAMLEMRSNNTLCFPFLAVLYSSFIEKIKIFAIIMYFDLLMQKYHKITWRCMGIKNTFLIIFSIVVDGLMLNYSRLFIIIKASNELGTG